MSDPVIQISDLQKSYKKSFFRKGVHAVKGLSLSIHAGEIFALIGPNGSGKTTTLHCLTGFFQPDRGTVRVFNQDPQISESRRNIGFHSEFFFTYSYRTAEQVMRFYCRLQGMKPDDLNHRIDEVLNLVGLGSVTHQKTGTFSKGMLQRLGLAQSVIHDPSLLIWDEPSSGLDPEGRRLVIDLIQDLKAKGKTILFSTHILNDIERVCDHVAILNEGKILVTSPIADLVKRFPGKSFEDIYLDFIRGMKDVE